MTPTPIYPDESDEENFSLYWPERTTSSPPRIPDPDSTVISTVNLTQWSISQQLWHQFRTNLSTNANSPTRNAPPQHYTAQCSITYRYLFNNQDPSPDTMQNDNRILGWAKSNLFWTEYLACLPPIT